MCVNPIGDCGGMRNRLQKVNQFTPQSALGPEGAFGCRTEPAMFLSQPMDNQAAIRQRADTQNNAVALFIHWLRCPRESVWPVGSEAVFFALHLPSVVGGMIIVSQQMQDAVNKIASKLSAEWNVVASAIFGGQRRADDQFTIERIGSR